MKFKSYIGKSVMVGGKILKFTKELYETEDKAEIEALSNAKEVTKIDGRKKSED